MILKLSQFVVVESVLSIPAVPRRLEQLPFAEILLRSEACLRLDSLSKSGQEKLGLDFSCFRLLLLPHLLLVDKEGTYGILQLCYFDVACSR